MCLIHEESLTYQGRIQGLSRGGGVDRVYKGAVIEPQRIYGGKKEENRFKIVQIKHAIISDLLKVYIEVI